MVLRNSRPEGVGFQSLVEYTRRIIGGSGQHESGLEDARWSEMIWFVWIIVALEILVIALGLRIMWVMIWEASRAPADPSSPPEHSRAQSLGHPPKAKGENSSLREAKGLPARFTLEEVDERGYVSTRKIHMGCEAAVCRTPFGARIVAGRHSLNEPQYAWDYASVGMAEEALVYAEFNTHPTEGIIGVEDLGRGGYPAAEPKDYFRRWRYTPDGQMEKF